jgi:hypothetical protein
MFRFTQHDKTDFLKSGNYFIPVPKVVVRFLSSILRNLFSGSSIIMGIMSYMTGSFFNGVLHPYASQMFGVLHSSLWYGEQGRPRAGYTVLPSAQI